MSAPRYLLDTNAIIDLRDALREQQPKSAERQQRIEKIKQRCLSIPAEALAMSFISWGELAVWAEKSANAAKSRALLAVLRQRVQLCGAPLQPTAAPPGAVESSADTLADLYGQVRAELERQGRGIGGNDTWIAAHALSLGLTIVTRDQEFRRVPNLQCEDWTA
jgi:tRNA(fMet)-specific endonuclease VapC